MIETRAGISEDATNASVMAILLKGDTAIRSNMKDEQIYSTWVLSGLLKKEY